MYKENKAGVPVARAKALNCGLEESELEFQPHKNVYFPTITLGNPLIPQLWVEKYHCCSSSWSNLT